MSKIKEKLINNAINTIRKSGIHKLTMRELGQDVNIKASSVMYHFKSKDKLILELVQSYNEEFFLQLEEINQYISNPKERINKLIDLYEASVNDEKLCLCGVIATESNHLDESITSLVIEFFNHVEKWLSENLSLLHKDELFAKVILSGLNGAIIIDNLKNHKIDYLNATRTMINQIL